MQYLLILTCAIFLCAHVITALPLIFRVSPYAPVQAQCPPEPLVRPADDLSAGEAQYVQTRYIRASENLRAYFLRLNAVRPANDTFPALSGRMPMMGFASSGGGVRALLAGAGVIQAMDSRAHAADTSPLSGLWQGFSYYAGLSGGSWLLGSLVGNDGSTVSSLTTDLWISSFSDPSFLPFGKQGPDTYARLFLDLIAKIWAGFPVTLVDGWGLILTQHLLKGDDTTLSGLVNHSDFQTFQVPYPVLTALAVNPVGANDECLYACLASAQFEWHPWEFGSWDPAVRTFASTRYMASALNNGMALSQTTCVEGYDNLGFLMGSSSNLNNYFCGEIPSPGLLSGGLGAVQADLIRMTSMAKSLSFMDEYGVVPNPFINHLPGQPLYASSNLYLVDGGEAEENMPLWPLIQPERKMDVISANDNSADTTNTWPNGTSLHMTFERAQAAGLTTMPYIPTPEAIMAQNPGGLPRAFGCYDLSKITIIWLPNKAYSFQSNVPSWLLLYSSGDVMNMIQNGNAVATVGGNATWPTCLACLLLNRSNQGQGLPSICPTCFADFCWPQA